MPGFLPSRERLSLFPLGLRGRASALPSTAGVTAEGSWSPLHRQRETGPSSRFVIPRQRSGLKKMSPEMSGGRRSQATPAMPPREPALARLSPSVVG